MPKTISKALEQRLKDSPSLQKFLADLHLLSGVEVLFLNHVGQESVRVPREAVSPLHRLDQRIPGLARIRQEVRQAKLSGRTSVKFLPWQECIHPMRIDTEPVGYLVLSAWRTPEAPLPHARAFWSSYARDGSDLGWKEFYALWTQLPEIRPQQAEAWKRQLALVADELIRQSESPREPGGNFPSLPPLIRDACEVVQEEFRTPLTLASVARSCGVSPEHLSRQFHRATGLRFRNYLAETRIHAVCEDLENTSEPISSIAERNGFPTLSRFNRTFRALTGRTPSAWRKRKMS